jgi:hypothetical protein
MQTHRLHGAGAGVAPPHVSRGAASAAGLRKRARRKARLAGTAANDLSLPLFMKILQKGSEGRIDARANDLRQPIPLRGRHPPSRSKIVAKHVNAMRQTARRR